MKINFCCTVTQNISVLCFFRDKDVTEEATFELGFVLSDGSGGECNKQHVKKCNNSPDPPVLKSAVKSTVLTKKRVTIDPVPRVHTFYEPKNDSELDSLSNK